MNQTAAIINLFRKAKRCGSYENLVIKDGLDGWQPELYVLTIIIQIIRLFALGDWVPDRARIAAREIPESVPAEWSSVDIEWGMPSH